MRISFGCTACYLVAKSIHYLLQLWGKGMLAFFETLVFVCLFFNIVQSLRKLPIQDDYKFKTSCWSLKSYRLRMNILPHLYRLEPLHSACIPRNTSFIVSQPCLGTKKIRWPKQLCTHKLYISLRPEIFVALEHSY